MTIGILKMRPMKDSGHETGENIGEVRHLLDHFFFCGDLKAAPPAVGLRGVVLQTSL